MKKSIILTMTLLAAASGVMAGTRDFSYPPSDSETAWWGTRKSETYNVAICIDNPALEGLKIKGITVAVPAEAEIADPNGWLSSQLSLEAGKRVADIAESSGQVENGMLTVTFDKEVEIGSSPIYAGYTFTVNVSNNMAADMPVAIVEDMDLPGSLFVASSRSVRSWKDYSSSLSMASAMRVLIDVDTEGASAGIAVDPFTHALLSDETKTLTAEALMVWPQEVSSIEYQISQSGAIVTKTVDFNPPRTVDLGHALPFEVALGPYDASGVYDMTLTVTKVNGIENVNPQKTAPTSFQVVEAYPQKRPLFEEYTGLWCGYCPMGLAAMQYMTEKYGDCFVCVAYHNKDVFSVLDVSEYPDNVDNFPYLYVDRSEGMHPFYCKDPVGFGTEAEWLEVSCEFTPVALTLKAVRDEADADRIKATCTADFAVGTGLDYSMEFILVADGLCNDRWKQSNHLSGEDTYKGLFPQLDAFIEGPDPFTGFVYDDVMLRSSSVNGDEISLGTPVMGDRIVKDYEFSTADILNLSGKEFLTADCTYRIVALVCDADGHCVNCVSAPVENTSGIDPVSISEEDIQVRYYLLDGTRIEKAPEKGLYLRSILRPDGTVATEKHLAK